jgi:hypothetical protein
MDLFNEKDLQLLMSLLEPNKYPDPSNDFFYKIRKKQILCCSSVRFRLQDLKIEEGLLNIKLDDEIKLELCRLLHILCDYILRYRIESLISFSIDFVSSVQSDQKRRYHELKQAILPSAVMARKTKEFRCPARDQMQSIVKFKTNANAVDIDDQIKTNLINFHGLLNNLTRIKTDDDDMDDDCVHDLATNNDKANGFLNKLFRLLFYSDHYDSVSTSGQVEATRVLENVNKNKYHNAYSALSDLSSSKPDGTIESNPCCCFAFHLNWKIKVINFLLLSKIPCLCS